MKNWNSNFLPTEEIRATDVIQFTNLPSAQIDRLQCIFQLIDWFPPSIGERSLRHKPPGRYLFRLPMGLSDQWHQNGFVISWCFSSAHSRNQKTSLAAATKESKKPKINSFQSLSRGRSVDAGRSVLAVPKIKLLPETEAKPWTTGRPVYDGKRRRPNHPTPSGLIWL